MAEEFASMSLNYQKKQEKETCEYQGKLTTLRIKNNQLLIEIKKWKQGVFMSKLFLKNLKKTWIIIKSKLASVSKWKSTIKFLKNA